MRARTVLVCGAGIAGPTVAYWLTRFGFAPTILERAPTLRSGGYVIDFWGLGYDIAEKMGLLPQLCRAGYYVKDVRIVDAHGNRISGFGTKVFNELTAGRFVTIRRSDLSRLIFAAIEMTAKLFLAMASRLLIKKKTERTSPSSVGKHGGLTS